MWHENNFTILLKGAVKYRTEVTMTMNIKVFDGDRLSHELLLKTRQMTKLGNTFESNISADINSS